MIQCNSELKRVVTLSSAVNAAMLDAREDVGRSKQLYTHWAARGLKLLYNQVLPKKVRRVVLMINKNTSSAVLPDDFDTEVFVGVINNKGHKVPLVSNSAITSDNFDTLPKQSDTCAVCGQDKDICEDLQVTEISETVVINGQPYELSSVKTLYPNGEYYLVTNTPYLDTATNSVVFRSERELLTTLDKRACGCLAQTKSNMFKLKQCNNEVYTCYYAKCDSGESQEGYKVFYDQNLIQFDRTFPHEKVYLEYNAFLQKKGGKYYIPEVAFETVVEWTKFKAVDGKNNVSLGERSWRLEQYKAAKRNMVKSMGKINFTQLVNLIGMTPKFD